MSCYSTLFRLFQVTIVPRHTQNIKNNRHNPYNNSRARYPDGLVGIERELEAMEYGPRINNHPHSAQKNRRRFHADGWKVD